MKMSIVHRFKSQLFAKIFPKVGHEQRYLDKAGSFHQRAHRIYSRIVQLRCFMILGEENSIDLLARESLLCPGCLELEVTFFFYKSIKNSSGWYLLIHNIAHDFTRWKSSLNAWKLPFNCHRGQYVHSLTFV